MNNSVFPRMHVSLYVTDLEKTISFYNQFFGRLPVKIKPGYVKYVLDQPSLIISFAEQRDRVQAHFGHLGFQVETIEVMQEALNRMKELRLDVREEMGVNCCYARQDKFWVNDPDGVEWEVYYFHEDAEFNDPRYDSTGKNLPVAHAIAPAECCTPVESVVFLQPCCDPVLQESALTTGKPCC
jgi:catechol 2,3-dioxygenase-like lactoylglutathione lyase family enzyme